MSVPTVRGDGKPIFVREESGGGRGIVEIVLLVMFRWV